ncbi:MAG: hypothetical protein JNJ88_10500 [Planctomycetes bacterium]|nr:hypothetical protein [Planctomycetota bacterium]
MLGPKGEPMAGVVVWASPPPRTIPPRPSTGRAIAARQAALESELDATHFQAQRRLEVRSKDDGTFTIPLLEDAPHTLEAHARGYTASALLAPYEGVLPGDSVDFILWPLVAVPVDVHLGSGAQVPFAMIQCHRFAAPNMSELYFEEPWRAEDPVLYLGAGRWEIRAKYDGLDDDGGLQVSEQSTMTLEDGVSHEPVRLKLRPIIGIRGAVRAAGENTLPALHIVLAADEDMGSHTPKPDSRRPHYDVQGQTRSASFEFVDLRPGRYSVHAFYGGSNTLAASQSITVRDRLEPVSFIIDPPPFATSRRIRVFGPDGLPMDGCTFMTHYLSEGTERFEDAQASNRRHGDYIVTTNLCTGEKLLGFVIRSQDTGAIQVAAPEGEGILEARFASPALVRLRIPRTSGGYLKAHYRIIVEDERLRRLAQEFDLFGDGSSDTLEARIGPVQPGAYTFNLCGAVQLESSTGNEELRPLQRIAVQVVSGENTFVLSPGQLYRFQIRVEADANVGPVQVGELRRSPEDGRSLEIDPEQISEGIYEYERVPPGRYHYIVQSRYGLLKRTVQIPGDGEQIVRLEPPNSLLVCSITKGSPVEGCLQEGDLVRAIDGISITSMERKEACLTLAYDRPESTWRIERNGETLDVTLRLRGLDVGGTHRLWSMLELVRR